MSGQTGENTGGEPVNPPGGRKRRRGPGSRRNATQTWLGHQKKQYAAAVSRQRPCDVGAAPGMQHAALVNDMLVHSQQTLTASAIQLASLNRLDLPIVQSFAPRAAPPPLAAVPGWWGSAAHHPSSLPPPQPLPQPDSPPDSPPPLRPEPEIQPPAPALELRPHSPLRGLSEDEKYTLAWELYPRIQEQARGHDRGLNARVHRAESAAAAAHEDLAQLRRLCRTLPGHVRGHQYVLADASHSADRMAGACSEVERSLTAVRSELQAATRSGWQALEQAAANGDRVQLRKALRALLDRVHDASRRMEEFPVTACSRCSLAYGGMSRTSMALLSMSAHSRAIHSPISTRVTCVGHSGTRTGISYLQCPINININISVQI